MFKPVLSVGANFGAAAGVSDNGATLTVLPSGKTARVRVTAVNDAGESAASAEVQAVVG